MEDIVFTGILWSRFYQQWDYDGYCGDENTIGLVNLLELRLGLHYDEVSAQERMALYYDAVSKYMEAHPKNVMAESFKTLGLTTAKAMLGWRDELRSAD